MGNLHKFLNLSMKRRAFVVGDIHGEFKMLEDALAKCEFDPEQDVILSVGDLCDRGPDSQAAFDWIQRPYFYRTLGNHDIVPRMFLTGRASLFEIDRWGGSWYSNLSKNEIEKIAVILEAAPVSMTALTPGGFKIGIAHADCLSDWDLHVATLDKTWVYDLCLWSRASINKLMKAQDNHQRFDVEAVRVANIDHVFHGHSILGAPFTIANRSWIDTGAYMGGDLTVVDVDKVVRRSKGV